MLRGIDLTSRRRARSSRCSGANGSGKSTLVRAMIGLRPLRTGAVTLFGTPLADFRRLAADRLRAAAGDAASGVPASVWEVVASGRLTRRRLLRPLSRADRAAIDDALEVVGLADRARDGVTSSPAASSSGC